MLTYAHPPFLSFSFFFLFGFFFYIHRSFIRLSIHPCGFIGSWDAARLFEALPEFPLLVTASLRVRAYSTTDPASHCPFRPLDLLLSEFRAQQLCSLVVSCWLSPASHHMARVNWGCLDDAIRGFIERSSHAQATLRFVSSTPETYSYVDESLEELSPPVDLAQHMPFYHSHTIICSALN
jgi:hypothetical protein